MPRPRQPASPFRYFNSSPEIIRLVVMMYVRFPLSLRNVEDLLLERGIDICHETVRLWWNRFGPLFAADIRRQRISRMRGYGRVAAFVRAWKMDRQREQQTSGRGTFVPLVFAPGEAFQFDWSEDWAIIAGKQTKLQVAHTKLSHSRAFIVRA